MPSSLSQEEASAELRSVFDAPDRSEAERLLGRMVDKYADTAPKLAAWLEANVPEGLTVFDFPAKHRRRLRTNNLLERLNREIKRRTRVATHVPERSFLAPPGHGGADGNRRRVANRETLPPHENHVTRLPNQIRFYRRGVALSITAGRAPLDHRTDIYSLGATLYELLTLQPPFPGKTRDEVIGQILHKEPRSPRRLNRRVPLDLETICLKSIERDPDRRYQSAKELAIDLRAFVSRHAISARRLGPVGKAMKYARRNPLVVSFASFVLLTALAVGIGYKLVRDHERELDRQADLEAIQDELIDDVFRGVTKTRRRPDHTGNQA